MCYSFKTSIVSYSLGMASAIYALFANQIILGMLILFYCQMQLSEALIWKGIDTDNTKLNRIGTKYGKYLLATHNIGIGLGILLYMYKKNKTLVFKDFIPLIIGIIFFLIISLFVYSKKDDKETYPVDKNCMKRECQNNNNRLKWRYPQTWYMLGFLISLIFFYIYIPSVKSKIWLMSCFIMTFLLSIFIVPQSPGSIWCFSSAILAPIIVLVNKNLVN